MHVEEHITRYMTRNIAPYFTEYVLKDNSVFDKDLCLIPEDVAGFIKDTQPEKYKALVAQFGSESETDAKLVSYAASSLSKYKDKTLEYFRSKLKINGQHLDTNLFSTSTQ